MIPDSLHAAFAKRTTEALAAFPNTTGQCVALCAYISQRLTEDGIVNRVALGSLSCNGTKTFQYKKMFPRNSSRMTHWDGHAWLEFPNEIIGEPSLFRTARVAPKHSNLRQNLEAHGIINRGAILISAANALQDIGLKYRQKTYLNEDYFLPLIDGLRLINEA